MTAAPTTRLTALNVYVTSVVVGATAILVPAVLDADRRSLVGADSVASIVFALLLIVGEARPLKWLRLNDGGELTASWAFALAILLLGAPTGALVAMATASLIGDAVHHKPLQRTAFNAAQITISLGAAAAILHYTGQLRQLSSGGVLGPAWFAAALAAAAALFIVNASLTCIALALHEGTSVLGMMRRGLPLNVSTDGALVALSPIFTVVAQRSLLLLPLLVVTAGFVYRSTRTALDHEHEANHDVLTTLLNRRAFMQRVSDELVDRAPTRYCGLILIDLDDFKQINDRLGHAVGDRVLQEVGRRLGSRSGEIAARLGGDEFAVLFTQVASPLVAQRKADALLAALSEPFGDLGFPLAISASVGVSVWPHDGDDADQLLQSADLAMYSAKRTGNSTHLYQHVQGSREVGRVTLLADLQAALTNHELVLWYQPQMQLATTTISGFEALIRWNHPRHGMVPPDQFMPLAEHTDLMGPITRFVVDRAAGDLAEWLRNDPTLRVAVNVSAQNLHDLDFPKFVSETLQRHAVPEDQFEIEITENAVLAHPERAHIVLDALTRSGVRVSIDDFGTGYSSLANLRSLPVTAIKVDRSFVTDMMTDADDRIVVRSVIDLGCSLGLIVIAEGVETDECLVELERMGCHAAQGWAIARPMPAAEVPTWLAAGCHRATSPIAALGTEQAAIPRIGLAS